MAAQSDNMFQKLLSCIICESDKLHFANNERLDYSDLLSDHEIERVLKQYDGITFELNRCAICGFLQPSIMPTHKQFFDSLYSIKWSDEWMHNEFTCRYKDMIFTTILKELGLRVTNKPRNFLDVGAHVGRMVYLASMNGWDAEGIELNPITAFFAAKKTGLVIHRQNAKDLASTGKNYNAIVLTDVLEHIPYPLQILRDLYSLLQPDGWVAIKVPCGSNQLIKQKIRNWFSKKHKAEIASGLVHVNHFSVTSLKLALHKSGFEEVHITIGAPELTFSPGIMNFLSRLVRKGTYYTGKILPYGVHTPLALNLQAYAKKPRN